MSTGYKEYNNYSQQDKDSMRTLAADTSNANESTLISQTDEVESLLGSVLTELRKLDANTDTIELKLETIASFVDGIEGKLDTLASHVDGVEAKLDAVTTAVQNADTHIVAAIQAGPQA